MTHGGRGTPACGFSDVMTFGLTHVLSCRPTWSSYGSHSHKFTEEALYGNMNYSMMHGSANPPPDPELGPCKTRKSLVCEQEQHRCCKVTGKNGNFCLCARLGFDPACLFSSIGTGTCCIARCRQRYMTRPAPGSSPRSLYLQCAGKIVIVQSFSLQMERSFGGIIFFP